MRCEDVDKRLAASTSQESAPSDLQDHIRSCPACFPKYSFSLLASLQTPLQEEVPGEADFLSRLQKLSSHQESPFLRAQGLHEIVMAGDRSFWQGDYEKAEQKFQEALLLAHDDQGRVALLNKLARAKLHRHRPISALVPLKEALQTLGEKVPSTPWMQRLFLWKERVCLYYSMLLLFLKETFPSLFLRNVVFGDRTHAAQHLYRELAILAQGPSPVLGAWAHLREIRLALRLRQPLEMIVAWGRHGVHAVQRRRFFVAQRCLRRLEALSSDASPICKAAASFYIGRISFLRGAWDESRQALEACVQHCREAGDACLREAALQHLIRVYRHNGHYADAIRIASQLLSLYHKLGNTARLSACCRHFALTYLSCGDLRRARSWTLKALEVVEQGHLLEEDRWISKIRCNILLADLEIRFKRSENARLYLGEAIRIQRQKRLPLDYIRDGLQMLRKILHAEESTALPLLSRCWFSLASKWAVMRGDAERALSLQNPRRSDVNAYVPEEIAYLYQEYAETEYPSGLREAIPASAFAHAFLRGEISLLPPTHEVFQDAELLAAIFPVGAISSRWGRGALARDFTGLTTTQFSNTAETPWGYFFADDIG